MTEVGSMVDRVRPAIALGLAVLAVGCGASDAGGDSAAASASDPEDAAVLAERAREVGEEAALALAGELFGRLNAEIEARGPRRRGGLLFGRGVAGDGPSRGSARRGARHQAHVEPGSEPGERPGRA